MFPALFLHRAELQQDISFSPSCLSVSSETAEQWGTPGSHSTTPCSLLLSVDTRFIPPSAATDASTEADGTDPPKERPNSGTTDAQRWKVSLSLNAVTQQSHYLLKVSFSALTTMPSQDHESGKTEEPPPTLVTDNQGQRGSKAPVCS